MLKVISAILAAITLMSVGSFATPVSAAGVGEGQYYDRGRYDDRYDRRDNYRGQYRDRDRYDRRDRRSSWWRQHVRRCERAYRSYNRRTDMYRTRSGHWRRCRL